MRLPSLFELFRTGPETAAAPDGQTGGLAEGALPGHLVVSFGLPKSASTFAWLLLKDILRAGPAPVATLSTDAKGARSAEDYVERLTPERLDAIRSEIGDGCVVVKTHNATPEAGAIERAGFSGNTVFVQHRDPRDIALSLIDHGRRSRAMGIPDFAECETVERSLWTIGQALKRMDSWMAAGNAIPVSYDALCFDTHATVADIAARLGVAVDPAAIVAPYADRTRIGQFNKGARARWRAEMSAEDSDLVLARFEDYYARFA